MVLDAMNRCARVQVEKIFAEHGTCPSCVSAERREWLVRRDAPANAAKANVYVADVSDEK
jgi:hypothetical protein